MSFFCPECDLELRFTHPEQPPTTPIEWESHFDADGTPHYHDPNIYTSWAECPNRHIIRIERLNRCPKPCMYGAAPHLIHTTQQPPDPGPTPQQQVTELLRLLNVYVEHVASCEGTDFLDDMYSTHYGGRNTATLADLATLRRLTATTVEPMTTIDTPARDVSGT